MATELLEEMVLPHLAEASVDCAVLGDDCVQVAFPTKSAGTLNVLIIDRDLKGLDILTVIVDIPAQFAADLMLNGLTLCNELGSRALGKFLIAEESVRYGFEWPVVDRSNMEQVRLMLSVAVNAVDKFYPAIMAARWGGATVEQALAAAESGGGESADPPALSDDELRRLLGDLDPEGDGGGA